MLRIIKRDLTLLFSDIRQKFFLIFIIPFFLLIIDTQNMEWLYFLIIMGVSHVLVLTPFYYDMNNKSSNLVASLPITRKEIIIYKYLGIPLYFLMTIVYVGIYLWIINKIGLVNVDYFNLIMIRKALPFTLISMSLTIFINFVLNMRIAQLANMIIYVTIIIFSSYLAQETIDGGGSKVIDFLNGSSFFILSIGIFILFMLFSIRLYENKDL